MFLATHSSTLAWKIPWVDEPGRLQSMRSLRVGHDWVTSLSLFHFHTLEKEMATHSSVLAWRIPGTGEPGGLPSLGSHRVGHDWSDLAAAAVAAVGSYVYFVHLPQAPEVTAVTKFSVHLSRIFCLCGFPLWWSTETPPRVLLHPRSCYCAATEQEQVALVAARWAGGLRCHCFSTWGIPGPGIEPVYPALAGRFLTTRPPEKSSLLVY